VLLKTLRARLFGLDGVARKEIVLAQRRVFMLPTRAGLVFGLILLLMLTGSINYGLSLGFILTFLLASVGITTILHTFRNIAGLRIVPARTPAVFAGEVAQFHVSISNRSRTDRYSIGCMGEKADVTWVDVPRESAVIAAAAIPALRRGLLRPGRLTLFSRFPLGLFQAWSYIDLGLECVVYPRPATPGVPLPRDASSVCNGSDAGQGLEDFSGLRQYQPGDAPRHIAWKAVAREQTLLTKQFAGGSAKGELRLALDQLPRQMPLEEKLSRLTRWVLDAHAAGHAYALELRSVFVPAGRGEAHRDRCLEALALFDGGDVVTGPRSS
jgi:uncharacterized protein (DUF58 family)